MAGTTYEEVIGPLLLGAMFGAFLCGFGLHMCVFYFTRYKHDYWLSKLLVVALTAISLLSFGGHIADLWWDCISTRGDDRKLGLSTKYGPIAVGAPVFACTLSQAFFAVRAFLLYRRPWLLGSFLTILLAGNLGAGIALIVFDTKYPVLSEQRHTSVAKLELLSHMVEAWLWVSAGVDLIITSFLIVRLARDRKGFNPRTDTILRRLLILTVSTGLFTSVYAITDAIVVRTTTGKNNALIGMSSVLPHIYTLTTIGSLNLRNSITAVGDTNNSKGYSSTGSHSHRFGTTVAGSAIGSIREFGIETVGTRRGRYELGEYSNSIPREEKDEGDVEGLKHMAHGPPLSPGMPTISFSRTQRVEELDPHPFEPARIH